MGHWEQIGKVNRRIREKGAKETGWRKVVLYAALFGISAFLWFVMLWPSIKGAMLLMAR